MESQRYHSMRDAYRSIYEAKGYQEGGEVKPEGPSTMPSYPTVTGGLRAAVVLPKPSVTRVNIEVNPQTTKVGDVDQAYYTFPAGFDPTNREDVASPSKKVEYKAEEYGVSIGDILDYLLESGVADTVEAAETLYNHMSYEWMEGIIDGLVSEGWKPRDDAKIKMSQAKAKKKAEDADKAGDYKKADKMSNRVRAMQNQAKLGEEAVQEEKKKGRCWTGYKPTPGKEPYSPGSCEKA